MTEEIHEQFGEGTMHLEKLEDTDPLQIMKIDLLRTIQEHGQRNTIHDQEVAAVLAGIMGMVRFYLFKAGMTKDGFDQLVDTNVEVNFQALVEQELLLARIASQSEQPKKKTWRDIFKSMGI